MEQLFAHLDKTLARTKSDPPGLKEKMDKFDQDFQRHMNMKKTSRKIDETRW